MVNLIYFSDPENVFLDTQYVVQGEEGQSVIIPCKPTSKYVTVELRKDDEV